MVLDKSSCAKSNIETFLCTSFAIFRHYRDNHQMMFAVQELTDIGKAYGIRILHGTCNRKSFQRDVLKV